MYCHVQLKVSNRLYLSLLDQESINKEKQMSYDSYLKALFYSKVVPGTVYFSRTCIVPFLEVLKVYLMIVPGFYLFCAGLLVLEVSCCCHI